MRGYKDQLLNSSVYNNSLKRIGRIDFWLEESIFSNWTYSNPHSRGGKTIYSDAVIELMLILSPVYQCNKAFTGIITLVR